MLYDRYHEAEFGRPNLGTYLSDLYHRQSELIAVFLCADYNAKEWCGLEWRALLDLIKQRQDAAIMPLRFDNTEVPGLFSIDGHVWIGDGRSPAEVADLILERWRINTGQSGTKPTATAAAQPRIDLTKLPFGAADFLGRQTELQLLDDAWSDPGTCALELTAPGGVSKTALVKRWLDRLRAADWRGAELVFGWSFFSQGTGDDRQASDDGFFSSAFDWFEVAHDPASSPWDKGKLLAQAVAAHRTLLVLDGVEPLQYPPGPMAPWSARISPTSAPPTAPGCCTGCASSAPGPRPSPRTIRS
ncbi:TIR domain-containing protein [uncultured Thiodictyon sp.]|uniref:TIR domain-containing protein n=1 Tax=uncultured Thiodictyon sp. TaxID=1846217 RepID=UPI0025F42321|nr:TIR domain-containing protein [uncultured Thiodictyon sp.]